MLLRVKVFHNFFLMGKYQEVIHRTTYHMLATFSDDCRKTKTKAIIIDQSQPTETTQSANQKIKSKYATGAAKRVKLKRGKKNVTQVKIGLD